MKLYFFLATFFVVFSCQKDTEELIVPLTVNTVLGSWQLKSYYVSPGGDTEWVEVVDGEIFKFKNDGTFTQGYTIIEIPDKAGVYVLDDDILELTYLDSGDRTDQNFSVNISETVMTLSPAGPSFCIEPCLYRYRKID